MRFPSDTPPTIPPQTCPIIDKAIRCLRQASDPDCDMVSALLADARDLLEEIREANGQLRDAVEWWQGEAESRQERIDEMESEAGDGS